MKLNLGCGKEYEDGFINVDIDPFVSPDKIVDLNTFPYPFDNNSVNIIKSKYFIEHLNDFDIFLAECYRILKDGGVMKHTTIYETEVSAWGHYQHKRCFNTRSLNHNPYFTIENVKLKFPTGLYTPFSIINNWLFNTKIGKNIYETTILRFIFPAYSVIFNLKKKVKE